MMRNYILLIIILFAGIAVPSSWDSEDHRAIYEMSKTIGPRFAGPSDIIFFIRPNCKISLDSIASTINELFNNRIDSITRIEKMVFKGCNNDSVEHPVYRFSCGLIMNGLFSKKYYSLYLYLDTIEEMIGISSWKWQSGFIAPPNENNFFAMKVKRLFLNKYKNAEYIGTSKTKCDINEKSSFLCSGAAQFWKWFKEYEEYLYDYDNNKARIDKYLTRKLRLIDYDIIFEIGPIETNQREIVIIGPEFLKERILKSVPKLRFWKVSFKIK